MTYLAIFNYTIFFGTWAILELLKKLWGSINDQGINIYLNRQFSK